MSDQNISLIKEGLLKIFNARILPLEKATKKERKEVEKT